ncbi:3D domain-containing protein [Synechocystis sp. PCC 7509]|uniref:3D domain-containing protein n=1 Tax=Synechocystis sp. PCC 7509 TaxID=927677 RepID=UPI0002AC182B|nr:3D domain-containing protein [Synechocystis sp. PCC 7509]
MKRQILLNKKHNNLNKMIKNFFPIVISASLINISPNTSIANTANQKTIFAQATENRFCPSEFEYDKAHRLCVSETEALGPFTNEMIAKCKQFGGGSPCEGTRWEVNFARRLRGTSTCPPGAKLDSGIGECVDNANVYGPFIEANVEKCRNAGGGVICKTMRFSRNILPSSAANATFNFPEPTNAERVKTLILWSTHYNAPRVKETPGGIPLLDISGNRLGAILSKRDWCDAAVEGTIQVLDNSNVPKTYNFAGRGSTAQVDCAPFFSSLSSAVIQGTNRSRFKLSKGAYGEGTDGLILVPYRTIAVDRTVFPIGSIIYIPEARGKQVTLPSGEKVVHDGYFFAGDVGGAIKNNHIDVFIGISQQNPFAFIKSKATGTFTAFLIEKSQISQALKVLHQ